MRGGGTKGAYEVGALKVMVDMLPKIDTDYDVVVGVSIGGMNAGLIALYKVGEEQKAVDLLYEQWLSSPVKSLWADWNILGPVEGIWRSSFVDNTNMVEKLKSVTQGKTF